MKKRIALFVCIASLCISGCAKGGNTGTVETSSNSRVSSDASEETANADNSQEQETSGKLRCEIEFEKEYPSMIKLYPKEWTVES